MDTMMAMKASFGCVNRPIRNENRRGWWARDGQGTKMSGFCNIGKNRVPRENLLHVSGIGDFGIGVSEDYDDHSNNGLVHGMVDGDGDDYDDEKTISAKNLDHWLHSSLPEIVKNVGEDPLLVHIYKENGPQHSKSSSSSTTKMKYVMEKVTSQSWMNITQRWENNCYINIPYGIIFVEELSAKQPLINSNNYNYYDNYNNNNNIDKNINYDNNNKGLIMEYSSSHGTKMWGVLVQGKGINMPSCYLLKTCKVNCCFGSTTHFCLAKVENNFFGNSVDFHLNKFWLQR